MAAILVAGLIGVLVGAFVVGLAAAAGRADERAAFASELLRRAEVERRLAAALRADGHPWDRTGDA